MAKKKPTTTAEREARKGTRNNTEKNKKAIADNIKRLNETKEEIQSGLDELYEKVNKKNHDRIKIEFCPKMMEEICSKISATTGSLDKILCSDERFPAVDTFYNWIDKSELATEMYARARQRQAHNMVDSIMDIACDDSRDSYFTVKGEMPNAVPVSRDRMKIDSIKWIVGKVLPKIYGDRTFNEATITVKKHEDILDDLA